MQVNLDIDAEVFHLLEAQAKRTGQPLSSVVEQLLRESLHPLIPAAPAASAGASWTEADADEAAPVAFAALDAGEESADQG